MGRRIRKDPFESKAIFKSGDPDVSDVEEMSKYDGRRSCCDQVSKQRAPASLQRSNHPAGWLVRSLRTPAWFLLCLYAVFAIKGGVSTNIRGREDDQLGTMTSTSSVRL